MNEINWKVAKQKSNGAFGQQKFRQFDKRDFRVHGARIFGISLGISGRGKDDPFMLLGLWK